jgi:hypothetical protein
MFVAASAASVVGLSAAGAFLDPVWDRPADATQAADDRTTYQAWDIFALPATPNTPDVADVNPNGTASAWDTSGASFVTSGGNIYSPSAILAMQVRLPGYGLGDAYQTRFLVQLRTLGSELDTTSLTLDGAAVSSLDGYAYAEVDRIMLGGLGGAQVDHAFHFTASGSADLHTLTWLGAESSVSQAIVLVDTQAVWIPEPTTTALAMVAGTVGVLRRRRGGHGQA